MMRRSLSAVVRSQCTMYSHAGRRNFNHITVWCIASVSQCESYRSASRMRQCLRSNTLFKCQHEPTTHNYTQKAIAKATHQCMSYSYFAQDSNPVCSFKPPTYCANPMKINQICFWQEAYFVILNQILIRETPLGPRASLRQHQTNICMSGNREEQKTILVRSICHSKHASARYLYKPAKCRK